MGTSLIAIFWYLFFFSSSYFSPSSSAVLPSVLYLVHIVDNIICRCDYTHEKIWRQWTVFRKNAYCRLNMNLILLILILFNWLGSVSVFLLSKCISILAYAFLVCVDSMTVLVKYNTFISPTCITAVVLRFDS